VGQPGPLIPQRGIVGQFYNDTAALGTTTTPPGSASATPSPTATLVLTRFEGEINDLWGQGSPDPLVNANNFFGVWTGRIQTTSAAGSYTFGTRADDGTRIWVNNTLVLDHWVPQGVPGTPNMGTGITLAANTVYDIRVEFFEAGGDAGIMLYWQPPGQAAPTVVHSYSLLPPIGPDAPTGLTATASTQSATPSVQVSWNASTTPMPATNYILSRATAPGGPYTQVAVQPGLTFTDNGVQFGTAYYYIVQGTAMTNILVGPECPPTGPATPLQPPVSASPTGITTSEAPTTATITLTINVSPAAAGTIQITSSAPAEALVSGQGNGDLTVQGPAGTITININAGTTVGTTFVITVTGQPDDIDDGDQPYTISFVVGGGGAPWTGATIGSVNGTNLDINTAGLLVTPTAGLRTDTNGGTDTFTVRLNSKPVVPVAITVTSSDTTEVTATPSGIGALNFDSGNWNVPQTVTLTGQGVNITYINAPFTISLTVDAGSDANYIGKSATVTGINLHLEVPPALKHVWGGGGCGLSGAEVLIPLGLIALWRRRRRRNA
jgi:hypothetical protein